MPSVKNDRSDMEQWRHHALGLIERQKTLVLATSTNDRSWATPVYFVYLQPVFFFFSSPKSRHMEDAMANQKTAACLFSDSDQWEQIEGLQMIGQIAAVKNKSEMIKATAGYLAKFPFARKMLYGRGKAGMNLSGNVNLYGFFPQEIYYMNNKMGFGTRLAIELPL